MKPVKHKYFFAIFYSLFLTSLTGFFILKTFYIPEAYQVVTTAQASTLTTEQIQEKVNQAVTTGNSYEDENISITIKTITEYETQVHIADVKIKSAEYLQSAFANNSFGRNITASTSTIASENNVILAINWDFYGFRNNGYVIRDGVLYRSTMQSADQQDLVIYKDGTFEIITEGEITAEELLAKGAMQVLSFGPGLINNGQIIVDENSEVSERSMSSNPRTAIGMIEAGHYLFIVSDGRTTESAGLSLLEMATIMQKYGVTEAYNLDGGGSSTMVFNGEVINNPTSGRGKSSERAISDILYIWY